MARILWIDDGCHFYLEPFAEELTDGGKHQVDSVNDCSEALKFLLDNHYDIVIIDPIGLSSGFGAYKWTPPPGDSGRSSMLIGCDFLHSLLDPATARIKLGSQPDISSTKIGVFSSFLIQESYAALNKLGITFRRDKNGDRPPNVGFNSNLKNFVEEILAN